LGIGFIFKVYRAVGTRRILCTRTWSGGCLGARAQIANAHTSEYLLSKGSSVRNSGSRCSVQRGSTHGARVRIVGTSGTHSWHVQLACTADMYSWHVQLARTAGAHNWHVQLTCTAGTYSWHVRLARTTGMYSWRAYSAEQGHGLDTTRDQKRTYSEAPTSRDVYVQPCFGGRPVY
jgi:hypothetical protein